MAFGRQSVTLMPYLPQRATGQTFCDLLTGSRLPITDIKHMGNHTKVQKEYISSLRIGTESNVYL
jgi:hypothetical protein